MPPRPYTAPPDAERCTAHAPSAAGGEGARCMKPRAPGGGELCKLHAAQRTRAADAYADALALAHGE